VLVATILAQNPTPPAGQGEEFGSASPVALVVILVLAAATIALIVSMNRRIKKLPRSFNPADEQESEKQDG
jgi:hypothetical protein